MYVFHRLVNSNSTKRKFICELNEILEGRFLENKEYFSMIEKFSIAIDTAFEAKNTLTLKFTHVISPSEQNTFPILIRKLLRNRVH